MISSLIDSPFHLISCFSFVLSAFDGHLLAAETCFDDPSITTLDLSYNHNFGNQGLIHLGLGLDKQSTHLSKLILRNVGLDLVNSNVTDPMNPFVALLTSDSARQFGVISKSTLANHLCTLILCDNPAFGDNGVQALCLALLASRVSTLRVLDLAETGITAAGVKELATSLLHSPEEEEKRMFHVSNSLQELDLSRNPLTCKGVTDLCTEGLMHNSTLTSLYLVQVDMKMEGPESLALVLANTSVCKLQHLSVSCNRMCGDRAKKTFNPQSVSHSFFSLEKTMYSQFFIQYSFLFIFVVITDHECTNDCSFSLVFIISIVL